MKEMMKIFSCVECCHGGQLALHDSARQARVQHAQTARVASSSTRREKLLWIKGSDVAAAD
ncbi:hypothetical protein L195_g038628, partial [Trifolium pratense]